MITFTPLNESHFPLLLKWLNAPHVRKWWDQEIIHTPESIWKKYQPYIDGTKSIRSYIINFEQTQIGYFQIYNAYDFERSKKLENLPEDLGAFDIFIGEEKFLGQNFASKAINKFLTFYGVSYAYMFADPDIKNIAAIKSYEKAGFIKISEQLDVNELWMLKQIKKIRLQDYELLAIKSLFKKYFLPEDNLWLFGSRVDPSRKGGDIDLYIETKAASANEGLLMKDKFLMNLEAEIGEQKIDIVLNILNSGFTIPIHDIAKLRGIKII